MKPLIVFMVTTRPLRRIHRFRRDLPYDIDQPAARSAGVSVVLSVASLSTGGSSPESWGVGNIASAVGPIMNFSLATRRVKGDDCLGYARACSVRRWLAQGGRSGLTSAPLAIHPTSLNASRFNFPFLPCGADVM